MPTTTTSKYDVVSPDGRFTIKVVKTYTDGDEDDIDFESDSRLTADIVNNTTGESVNIIDSLAIKDPTFKFSPDGNFLIFNIFGKDSFNDIYYVYKYIDLNTKETYFVTESLYEADYTVTKIDFTADGSKILYTIKGYDGSVQDGYTYIPSVPQLTAATASGPGITGGDGTVSVGQTVALTVNLIAVDSVTNPEKITLSLNTGAVAVYDAAASVTGKSLVFKYTVKVDQAASDLAVTALNLNGATLSGAGGRAVVIDGPLLAISGKLVIDGYTGTAAGETFLGTSGAETFQGGGGDDTYLVDNAGDRVVEAKGGGSDTVVSTISYALAAGQEVETLQLAKATGTQALNLTGNEFANTVRGNGGDNVLDGGGGADTMIGGAGNDTYRIDSRGDVVVEVAGQGNDTIVTSVSYALSAGQSIETLRANAGTGRIDLTGNEIAQTLIGNGGDNTLDGKGGADLLEGLGGNDTYGVDNARDRVIEARGGGNDQVIAAVSYALEAGQEIETLRFANAITGSFDLSGNEFGQTIRGNGGDNTLDGKGGVDILIGLGGNDTYGVDDARDQVIEAVGGGNDQVVAATSYTLGAGQEIETLRFANAFQGKADLTGNEFAQTIRGNGADNILDGKGGADILAGGGGNDTYAIDDARDQVIEARGQGNDLVVTTTSYTLAAGQEIEALQLAKRTAFANYNLTGNEFGQTIRGNDGNNVLDGKGGADVLFGNAGQDAFLFSTALGSGNVARIADFAPVDDTIRLAKSVFTALAPGDLSPDAFKIVNEGAVDANDRILYDSRTGQLSYDTDGSGKAAAVVFAVLDNKASLTNADFFVV